MAERSGKITIGMSEKEYNAQYPGYIHSKNSPQQPADALETVRQSIIADNKAPAMDYTFHGATNDNNNLFARIVRGELDQWRVWESSTHVAFLTPFANTPGFTVLVPRRHLSSDILALSDSGLYGLEDAIYQVSQLLKSSLWLERIGVIFEGFEIDYAHAKLIPMHPNEEPSNTSTPSVDAYSLTYRGFVSSKPGPRVPARTLLSLSQKLGGLFHRLRQPDPRR
ncbi:hypothetical protein PHISP_05875 [Aspergillus sp. HF37]|nr:hypothetical protein PHISP_05875 [Aspergillus sp. HF37]